MKGDRRLASAAGERIFQLGALRIDAISSDKDFRAEATPIPGWLSPVANNQDRKSTASSGFFFTEATEENATGVGWVTPPAIISLGLDLRLCLDFSAHLAAVRSMCGPFPTTNNEPTESLTEAFAFPHLVAVAPGPREIVLWELMLHSTAERLCVTEECSRTWSGRLSELLRLRSALRRGELGDGQACVDLLDALNGRYLSFKFVCEHPGIIEGALAVLPPKAN